MNPLEIMIWVEEDKKGDNLLWDTSPAAMENTLDLLLKARLKI